MVKNALIVPVGAKGGFVVKTGEVVDAYRTFVGALLDVTDNVVEGRIVPPEGVVRHDGDDAYLVVAADKGTATFSDVANEIAVRRGFWLGDAFASGGSAGYDHKRMGITARGAWESVRRHFRGLGVDVANEEITVVGIGDMSGDVFGNGMLLSRHIRLVAAFDHRHVFLDPDPDAAAGFAERERLFGVARSTWDDYDRSLISAGGGVFPRTAKAIPVSPEARRALGVDAESLPPSELIQAILRAPVDLLWSGGVGTYVKSSEETHAEAGDRSNDGVRVDGDELRCRVVGEGGNLGFTQRGRIEYALDGGLIFTDAIDNAGGVNCSDHEVNIKILLHGAIEDGSLAAADRDVLLAVMRDAVGERVIEANRAQALALSLEHHDATHLLDGHIAVIHTLETRGALDRDLEGLPDDEELANRRGAGQGLTQPELAVLLAHAKMTLRDELVASDRARGSLAVGRAGPGLPRAAPRALRRRDARPSATQGDHRHPAHQPARRPRRDRPCPAPARRHRRAGGRHRPGDRDRVGGPCDRRAVGRRRGRRRRGPRGRARRGAPRGAAAGHARNAVAAAQPLEPSRRRAGRGGARRGRPPVSGMLPALLHGAGREAFEERVAAWTSQGLPEALARRGAGLQPLAAALDVADVAAATASPIRLAAGVYGLLGERLSLDWLYEIVTRARPQQPLGGAGADVAARRPLRRPPHTDRARAARGGGRRPRGARRRVARRARRRGRPRARAPRRRPHRRRPRPCCAGCRGARGQRSGGQ